MIAPAPLRYHWQTSTYHALPVGGGLDDQPHKLMLEIQAAARLYHLRVSFLTAQSEPGSDGRVNATAWLIKHPEVADLFLAAEQFNAAIDAEEPPIPATEGESYVPPLLGPLMRLTY